MATTQANHQADKQTGTQAANQENGHKTTPRSLFLNLQTCKPANLHPSQLLLALIVLAYACIFTYLTFLRFDAFEARSLDLGNFDQAIWNTAHGRWFHLTNQPGIVNRLSLHVEPILIPISALYWLYSSPKTLLILQAIVVSLGAIPLYAIAKRELKNPWLALIFSLTYLLNPSIQAANWLEFHGVTLAPTFLLAAFYYLSGGSHRFGQNGTLPAPNTSKTPQRHDWLFILFAILAASCKEESALLIFMMGFYAVVIQRRYQFGGITMAISISWALFAVLGIQQFFGAGNIHWGRYNYLGDGPLQMLQTLLTQPQTILAQLQKAQAGLYLARLLIPVAFLALLAPEVMLLSLPSLAINMLADFSPMHQVDALIYAAPIVPFMLIAGVFGLRRLLNLIDSHQRARRATALVTGALILGATLANHIAYGYTPGSGNYLHLEVTEHHRQAQAILNQIPPSAKVSAQDRLNPHVSQRETVYIYPRVEDPLTGNADTIFIDVTGPAHPLHPSVLHQQIQEWMASGFGVAAAQDGYLLLSRNAQSTELPPEFYTAWQVQLLPHESGMPSLVQPVDVTFGELIKLTGIHVTTDRYGELITELTWQLIAEHERDLTIYVTYLNKAGQPLHSTDFYPLPASLWYPTSLWRVTHAAADTAADTAHDKEKDSAGNNAQQSNVSSNGSRYKVRTLPWTLDTDEFTLAVGVFYADSGSEWGSSQRLTVSSSSTAYPILEGNSLVRIGGYQQIEGEWVSLPKAAKPAMPLDTRFGQQIVLNGVTLKTPVIPPGEQIEADLTWQAIEPIEQDYSLFVHLISEQGDLVAQLDRQPADQAGFLPMTSWPTTQVVDTILLDTPETVSQGKYRLLAGLYFWQDGQRLPVSGPQATTDNAVELGWIEITN